MWYYETLFLNLIRAIVTMRLPSHKKFTDLIWRKIANFVVKSKILRLLLHAYINKDGNQTCGTILRSDFPYKYTYLPFGNTGNVFRNTTELKHINSNNMS